MTLAPRAKKVVTKGEPAPREGSYARMTGESIGCEAGYCSRTARREVNHCGIASLPGSVGNL